MNTVAILSFVSVIVLATVTFIFMNNTRKRIVEIKQDIKTNKLMMSNNLSKVVGDYSFNDDLLNNKFAGYEQHTHSEFGGPPTAIVDTPEASDETVTEEETTAETIQVTV